jgi:hypothetical protein
MSIERIRRGSPSLISELVKLAELCMPPNSVYSRLLAIGVVKEDVVDVALSLMTI